jgi:hypothetical protein
MRRLITAAAIAISATTAAAQNQNCAPHEMVVERLAEKYGEVLHSIGIGANNSVVSTWANPESGSWTITVTMPNGMACLVASGQSFERVMIESAPQGTAL